MPVATTPQEVEMNAKVAEICEIMFNTLHRKFPDASEEYLIEVTSEIMGDINNAG